LARKVTAIQYLVQQCIVKAFDFAEAGYRPCVFMGDTVTEYFAPWLLRQAGHKQWYGHWWEGSLQESTNTKPFESQLYMPAKMPKKSWAKKKVLSKMKLTATIADYSKTGPLVSIELKGELKAFYVLSFWFENIRYNFNRIDERLYGVSQLFSITDVDFIFAEIKRVWELNCSRKIGTVVKEMEL
jgi:hypothetical protein